MGIRNPQFKPVAVDMSEVAGNTSVVVCDLKNSREKDEVGFCGLGCSEGSSANDGYKL